MFMKFKLQSAKKYLGLQLLKTKKQERAAVAARGKSFEHLKGSRGSQFTAQRCFGFSLATRFLDWNV